MTDQQDFNRDDLDFSALDLSSRDLSTVDLFGLDLSNLDLSTLNISSLTHLCRRATDRYFQGEASSDRFCLEMFRRALNERDEMAWQNLVEQYGNLVQAWVQRHHSFPNADEEADYFINRTFDNFWRAFSRDPQKLSKFKNLKSLLQYMKLCAHTAVQEYVERQMWPQSMHLSSKPVDELPGEGDPLTQISEELYADSIWRTVVTSLNSLQEQIIAESFLIYDMKPREIYARNRKEFSSVGEVRRVKENMMARLRRNKKLLEIFRDGG